MHSTNSLMLHPSTLNLLKKKLKSSEGSPTELTVSLLDCNFIVVTQIQRGIAMMTMPRLCTCYLFRIICYFTSRLYNIWAISARVAVLVGVSLPPEPLITPVSTKIVMASFAQGAISQVSEKSSRVFPESP